MAVILIMDIENFSSRANFECRRIMQDLNDYVRYLLSNELRRARKPGEQLSIVTLPTGDGMAICFDKVAHENNGLAALKCAFRLQQWARELKIKMRFGIHTGELEEIEDVNYCKNVCGNAINMAQRIMDVGDGDHILCSDTMEAAYFRQGNYGNTIDGIRIKNIGEHKVKHGISINLYNIFGEYEKIKVGREDSPETKWHLHVEIDPRGISFIPNKRDLYEKAEHTIFVGITNENLVNHLYGYIIDKKAEYKWKKVEVFFADNKLLDSFYEENRSEMLRRQKHDEAIVKIKEIIKKEPELVLGYEYKTPPHFGMTCLDYDKYGGLIIVRPYIWGFSSKDCPAIYYSWDEKKANIIYSKYREGIDNLRKKSNRIE